LRYWVSLIIVDYFIVVNEKMLSLCRSRKKSAIESLGVKKTACPFKGRLEPIVYLKGASDYRVGKG
jgi:hypothetical protein